MASVHGPVASANDDELPHLQTLALEAQKFPSCYPDYNPTDAHRAHIATRLSQLTKIDALIIYPTLQWAQTLDNGDLILAVPALRVKGRQPEELAEEWARDFPASPFVEKAAANGIFLQFFFKPSSIFRLVIPSIFKSKKEFGKNPIHGLRDPSDSSKGRKRMVVEFSSPNIAKPFHAGHLRSTIIGGFLSNLYEGAGWDVLRLNYLGDWGKQYGLLALGYERYGDEKALEANPIGHLFDLYVKINGELSKEKEEIKAMEANGKDATELKNNGLDEQARRYFKAMCDNDTRAIALWQRFRELSVERYAKSYVRLNIHFDEYLGESKVKPESMEAAEKLMFESNLIEDSEGAKIVDFTKHVPGKEGKGLNKALIRKRDGTSLYLTRDIGALFERDTAYNFDQMIYVVASDQVLHMQQLFKIIDLTGNKSLRAKVSHVTFGLVLGMSTRRGTVKFLDDILRDVGDHMHEVMRKNEAKYKEVEDPERIADILGISSVMVQDMTGKRINNYHFNMDAMTSFEGDTGPYLQYAHARLCSIFRKAGIPISELENANLSLLTERHAIDLIRLVSRYPDILMNALKTHEPTTILTYLFKMVHALSSSYEVLKVLGSETEVMKARLALYESARVVLNNGMRLLGLSPVDRM
ncbi:hypothetical protein MMC31_005657 [Peltigera leucophlebia]|nr:hypothetical protein [Peltigera leucophlebia]